ncbi:MAG TPA: carboxypeptidase-like regulatory domain-containing protein [Vicinamibacterales bacterium]|nr:carboxypeptidase-like regulatory domain-containing protein [Vicinamibacterales bacterium]
MNLMWAQGRRAATTVALIAGLLALFPTGACRQGVPVIDTTPRRPDTPGTISGTVRGPEGTSSIEGRVVEVVNVDTGERQQTTTNNAGGFTFKVAPGRYRVEVSLREGEVIVKQPGTLRVNPSDVDAHADFIVGSARAARPRFSPSTDSSLAPPMA